MPSHLIIGQTQTAQKIAQKLAPFTIAPDIDCLIVQSEENSLKIAQVREIKQFLTKKPYHHDHQIVFIKEAHLLTIPAQNALLKTLEEPPEHALIFLATQFPDRLLPTILSRCHIHSSAVEIAPVDHSQFGQYLSSLSSKTLGQKISHALEFAYPKSKAIEYCHQAIYHFHQQLRSNPSISHTTNARIAQTTLDRIEANVDPRLSLEHMVINLLV